MTLPGGENLSRRLGISKQRNLCPRGNWAGPIALREETL